MKIIKQGQLPGEKVYNVTCRNCKTEFEFKKDEANYVPDNRNREWLQIACPICKVFCYIVV